MHPMTRRGLVLCLCALALTAMAAPALAAHEEDVTEATDGALRASGSRKLLAPTPTCSSTKTYDSTLKKCVCKPGYAAGSYNTCYKCKPGYYKSSKGNKACTQCPSGYYYSGTGATKCNYCQYGLVNPYRTKCQYGCKTTNDQRVIHFGPFWSVNWNVYWQGYSSEPSAAKVCGGVHYDGAKHLIPAIIKNNAQKKVAAKLSNFAFKCLLKDQPADPYQYHAWVLKGNNQTSYPSHSHCNEQYHQTGDYYDGEIYTIDSPYCNGPNGYTYPVLCSEGCAPYCHSCDSSGKCKSDGCVWPYQWSNSTKSCQLI